VASKPRLARAGRTDLNNASEAWLIATQLAMPILTLVSLFFGLVMGHTWFRDPDVM
jgi:hypothetical protein